MATVSIVGAGGFNNREFWVDNSRVTENEQFSGLISRTGGALLGPETQTYSTFSFTSDGLTYRYIGEWTISADRGLLAGSIGAEGYYDRIEVLSGDQMVATYDGDPLAVDFGSFSGEGILGLLGNLVSGLTGLLFGGTQADTSYANLHLDATPNLPDIAVASGLEAIGGSGPDILTGGGSGDRVSGGDGADWIEGRTGDDILSGGSGTDRLDGGDGNDWLEGNLGYDLLIGGSGNDTLYGGADQDVLYGDAGSDLLSGDDGNDFLYGGDGDDLLLGGAGTDTLSGDAGNDILAGGDNEDRLSGGSGNDWLEGNAGNDVILGGAGADRLDGGDGNDYLVGGPGYDLLIGGAGNDVFEFHRSDLQEGVWSTIADFGKTPGTDYDGILLEGFGSNLAFYQDGADALIYSSDIGLTAGIIVADTTIQELHGHLGFV